jgi:hypothetical protein
LHRKEKAGGKGSGEAEEEGKDKALMVVKPLKPFSHTRKVIQERLLVARRKLIADR